MSSAGGAHYKRTIIASFIGIFNQALTTNLIAIVFMPMMRLYDLEYGHLGLLVAVNFVTQVVADLVFSGLVDRIGFKKVVIPANFMFLGGLLLLALSPVLFLNNVLTGVIIATVVYSFSGGMCEIALSPLVDAVPDVAKGKGMGLLHAFYAWGQVATIIVTTLLLLAFGDGSWPWIAAGWAIVPLADIILFFMSPFPATVPAEKRTPAVKLLLHPFYIFCLLAIMFGAAAEVTMNQWTSTFLEQALSLPKVWGDLLGMCGFAVTLGIGRTVYGIWSHKIKLSNALIGLSVLASVCYLAAALLHVPVLGVIACALCGLGVSLLWPGTLVFGLLAVAGDIGAAVGPWVTGAIVDARVAAGAGDAASLQTGLLAAAVFPVVCVAAHAVLKLMNRKKQA